MAVYLWVEHNNLPRQPSQEVHIQHISPCLTGATSYAVTAHFVERTDCNVKQRMAVDVHKVSSLIEFQRIALALIVSAFLPYMSFKTAYSIVRPTFWDTGIRVLYECSFK